MNELPQEGISQNVKSFIGWLFVLGLACTLGGYLYYVFIVKNGETYISSELDSARASEEYDELVESMPKANPEDQISSKEVQLILKANGAVNHQDTLTAEDRNQIILNNTISD